MFYQGGGKCSKTEVFHENVLRISKNCANWALDIVPTLDVPVLFFSSAQRDWSTFYALCTFTIVLSISFWTHPKPLTWKKKSFQSRRVPSNFSALWDFPRPLFRLWDFFENFEMSPKGPFNSFETLQQNGCWKSPQGPPFYIFRHYETAQNSYFPSDIRFSNIYPPVIFFIAIRFFDVTSEKNAFH